MSVIRSALTIAFATAACASHAADKPTPYTPTPASGWIVTVKANAVSGPRWDGADTNGFIAYPSVSFRRPGTTPKWASPDDGIGFSVVDTGVFELGPVARIRSGRYNGSDRRLTGVHDVKWTVEPGLFANFWITPNLRARAEARHGFRSQDGFHASFGVDWVQAFDRFTFAIGPRLDVADAKFMRTNYGVTFQDSAWNPLVWAYRPSGGVKSYGVYSSLGYQFNDAWSATLHGGYNRLTNKADNSPVVRRFGSPDQFMIGLQFAYSFPVSGF